MGPIAALRWTYRYAHSVCFYDLNYIYKIYGAPSISLCKMMQILEHSRRAAESILFLFVLDPAVATIAITVYVRTDILLLYYYYIKSEQ